MGSFISEKPLGYVPVQQGGGVGQGDNKIRLGWDGGGVRLQVDGNASFGHLGLKKQHVGFNQLHIFELGQAVAYQNTRGVVALYAVTLLGNNNSNYSVFDIQTSFDGVGWNMHGRTTTYQNRNEGSFCSVILQPNMFIRCIRIGGSNTAAYFRYSEYWA
jgi:hypothetical protein